MKNLTIVFDLDGTLVDTAPDLLNATNHALEAVCVAPVGLEGVRASISGGARRMIERALEISGVELSQTKVDALLEIFLEHYVAHIAVESRPYPGVVALLARLREIGSRLAVCTNKLERPSRRLLHELALLDFFHAVVGRDTLPICKPDPAHLVGSVILADGNPNRSLMIGDSETDVATAKAAGVPIIAVSFGYSLRPIAELEPDAVIDSYGELPPHIKRLGSRY